MARTPLLGIKNISNSRRTNRSFFSRAFLLLMVLSSAHNYLMAQAANNTCATAQTLTVNGDCSTTAGDLYQANTSATITGACISNTRPDVWYRFTLPANTTFVTIQVTLTSATTTLTTANTNMELFNASNCTLTNLSLGCQTIASARTYTNLTGGNTYYLRISTSQTVTANPGNWNFNICLTSNDVDSKATTITPGVSRDAHLFGASATTGVPVDCATGNPDDDVWFKFTAVANGATVTLTNLGGNLTNNVMLQMFSGTPGSLTSLACGKGIVGTNTGIIAGNTYYFRVYSTGTGQAGFNQAGGTFRIWLTPTAPTIVTSGRMREIYRQTTLSAPSVLADPWEITYGPDNKLWITESKGYRLYRMDPVSGARDTVLDVSNGSTFLPVADQTFNMTYNIGSNNPQGGFAGLALHPQFLAASNPKNFVYVSYVHSYVGGSAPNGIRYINRVVRFTYNTSTGKLGSPVSLCDTLPGSNDHNSQRMIIAPVSGTYYLFYAEGDMGAGQFDNRLRPNKAQDSSSYEGKILRFNLESDGDAGLNAWIPNDNPYSASLGVQSAVWVTGIRNNQGFAYDPVLNKLYGSSHGPYSDDELNVIERGKNYGHPIVIGYAADSNYNGSTAGAALTASGGVSSCPPITDETGTAAMIPNYKDPLFSAYAQPRATIQNIWNTNPGNGGWPSEGWSGLDIYTHTLIPGWYKSLVASSLKWGRLVRIRLRPDGDSVTKTGATDTSSYFGSTNRFRDLAIVSGGKDFYVIMDRSATTSGPTAGSPLVPACGGCVQKYSFVGYADSAGRSSLSRDIDISRGLSNNCATGTTVTIDASNSNYWVPITGPDGDIMAEIYANGQTLGQVTSSFYRNTNPVRTRGAARYLDRNINIQSEFAPGSPVKVRFYITKQEFDLLDADVNSQITTLTDLKIMHNADACNGVMVAQPSMIDPTFSDTFDVKGYVLQSNNINSFSSFYFGAMNLTLPVNLLSFTGQYKNESSYLKWETTSEVNTEHFIIERSLPNAGFEPIGKVDAKGSPDKKTTYNYIDENVFDLGVPFVTYRLKMVDKDGEYKYSNTVTIYIPEILTTIVNIFPNPANKQTVISITSPREQKITWQLIDNTGRTVLNNTGQVRKGNTRITIDLNGIPAGSYFLKINGNYVNTVQKLQKL